MKGKLILLLLLLPGLCLADDFRPLYVELNEANHGQYTFRIKLPPGIPASNQPGIQFPGFCNPQPGRSNTYTCSEDIAGEVMSIRYPGYAVPNSSVIKMNFLTGESHTITMTGGDLEWQIPEKEEIATVAVQYTWLGIEHIWIGFDHLLFVLCLIWIAGTWRRILITITGFTLAHSITLALAAMEIVRLPVPPIEAVIALSVMFLAVEITRGRRNNLTWNYPVAVSSSFGLLHGLGFAAVLSEIGLPRTELLTGLVCFNIGVEVGQVLFALGVVLVLQMVNQWARFAVVGQTAVGYFIGVIATYWFIERTSGFFL